MSPAKREHKELKAAYRELFVAVRDVLYRYDLMGINQGAVSPDATPPLMSTILKQG